jgi:O-succinylbenzoate synthase
MKIVRVDLLEVKIPLAHHFETSYGRMMDIHKMFLKAYTEDRFVYADSVVEPGLGYTYETPETARAVLVKYILPLVLGKEINGPDEYWRLIAKLRGHPMTKASMDNVIWIFKALEENQSLSQISGGDKTRIISGGVSVGIQDSIEAFLDVVRERIGRGAHRIKLKIMPGWDIKVLEAIRKNWPDMSVSVDANNCYDYYRDHDFLTSVDRFNLLMFEQPLSQADLYYHARLQAEIKTPICLDESIHGPYYAQAAAEMKACKIINIKQARCGGLTPAKKVHDIALANGIGCWCGGMIESGIGMTLNTAVAAWPNMVYPNAVYSNANFLVEDVIKPITAINPDGTVDVPTQPGLGVEVDEKIVDRYTLSREVVRA